MRANSETSSEILRYAQNDNGEIRVIDLKMSLRFIIPFIFYSFFFLFCPGDSYYFHIFAHHGNLFSYQPTKLKLKANPMPYLKYQYNPTITAAGVYLVDLASFTPIFEKNANSKFLPASTTKILTALVAFENFQLDEILTVKRAILEPQTMGLLVGEKISFENLLYGLLVHSGNDAALALADNFTGGERKFVDEINKKAADLFMKNSSFKNPAGFDEFSQYTNPFDLALVARELLNNKTLARIVATKNITVSDTDFKYFHKLQNVNKLLGEIPGIGGLKTGYTDDAGENLISFYKKNAHQFIIVVLKSEDRFSDTKNIVEWLNNNVGYVDM
jgi:D-alanyl-D-alanine carboxypeptidase